MGVGMGVAMVAVLGAGCKGGAPAGGTVAATTPPPKVAPPKTETPGTPSTSVKKPGTPTFTKPDVVRGIYVTAWTAGGQKRMQEFLDRTKTSQINAFVIDVRDDGEMYFKTGIPLAKEAKAETIAVTKPDVLMKRLSDGGVYPIARIACFRDHFVPKTHPDQAVQLDGGAPWKDKSGHTWLDPYNRKNWEYLFATVDYAMDLGFPEIQLDYVRFPSEGKAGTQRFAGKKTYPDQKASPSAVITEFCREVAKRTKARGVIVSADIFGIISSGTKDQGIGQTLEMIAEPFDLINPMIYPSHFAKGEYGIANPNASPYAIIQKSLADFKRRVPKAKVRPWLQDFSLGVKYGPKELLAQIKASKDVGYDEYLLWNASNRYTWSALERPKARARSLRRRPPLRRLRRPRRRSPESRRYRSPDLYLPPTRVSCSGGTGRETCTCGTQTRAPTGISASARSRYERRRASSEWTNVVTMTSSARVRAARSRTRSRTVSGEPAIVRPRISSAIWASTGSIA